MLLEQANHQQEQEVRDFVIPRFFYSEKKRTAKKKQKVREELRVVCCGSFLAWTVGGFGLFGWWIALGGALR